MGAAAHVRAVTVSGQVSNVDDCSKDTLANKPIGIAEAFDLYSS
jgi:hypothetical protein